MRRLSAFTALAGYGGLLVALRPHWADAASWGRWSADPERALVEAAALAGWVLAAWLFVATALALAAKAPSSLGRIAAGAGRIVTPRVARRMLEGALGVVLAVGPAGAAMAGPATSPAQSVQQFLISVPAPIVAAAAPTFPNLDRPSPAPATPRAAPTTPHASQPAAFPIPVAPTVPAITLPHTAPHTVAPGDTLWGLAAAASPSGASPEVVTRLWQQWYAANRAAVGADPNLLLPGELLSLPSSS